MRPFTGVERDYDENRRRNDLPSLTGLRFFAALLVFFAHASLLNNPLDLTGPVNFYADDDIARGMADFFEPAGYVGVSFFFVLSGFVLTWSWSRKKTNSAGSFLRRRLVKVFPNHLVAWAVVMWLYAGAFTPMRAWLPNLFLLHSYSWRPDISSSVNVPAWSLCSEVLFYLLFPLIIGPLTRIADRRLWLWAGGMVAGIAAVALVAKYLIPSGQSFPLAPLPMTKMWFAYLFPPARLFEFVLGALLARIVAAGRWPRVGAVPVLLLAAAGYTAALNVPAPYDFSLTTVVPIAAIICTAASADLRGERGVLNGPVMVWLGTVSFGFYMIQAVPIFYGRLHLFDTHTYGFLTATALLVLLFAATLLAGWLLYRFVETPVMRRFGRGRRDRTPIPAVPAQQPGPVPAPTPAPPGTSL
ncbi:MULTISPECIES: acyltransferase [unclassified Streptomyces]|uniref:acyltransferase family protein n=1 Tax=unclassified Streptomyces TaxID=2593676 RepID=UPI0033DB6552